jgi:hypothetical protein
MIKTPKTLLSLSIALALAACGDSSTLVTSSTSSAGKGVDGYLSGSQVLCDTNNDGVKNNGEVSTTTNATGDFSFTPACASVIVISGGTSIDTGVLFKGLIKAPAGSAVATPLTSLMVSGGLTAAQVATAMGLAAGTDVTKIDPMLAGNFDLRKKTVAMQVIIQQITDTLGGLAGDASPATIQALYSQVAKAVAKTMTDNPSVPLVSSTGVVNPTLVSAAVVTSVVQLAATTDTVLLAAKTATSGLSSTSLASLITESVATQASTTVAQTDATNLVATTTSLQKNTAIANIATASKDILTSSAASTTGVGIDWTAVKTQLAILSGASTDGSAAAVAAINAALATAAAAADVDAPVIPSNVAGDTNSLSINSDTLTFTQGDVPTTATLTEFKSTAGITLAGMPDTISFAYTINGSPIAATTGSVISVGLSIKEIGKAVDKTREVKVILDKVNLGVSVSSTGTKTLTATVPADAVVYAYGVTSAGVTVYKKLTNTTANQLLAVSGTDLSFNVTKVLNVLMDKADSVSNYPFGDLLNVTGVFDVTMLVSNLNVASGTTGAVQSLSLLVPLALGNPQSLNGLGIKGKFTLQSTAR